jgi:hypothetical protein
MFSRGGDFRSVKLQVSKKETQGPSLGAAMVSGLLDSSAATTLRIPPVMQTIRDELQFLGVVRNGAVGAKDDEVIGSPGGRMAGNKNTQPPTGLSMTL